MSWLGRLSAAESALRDRIVSAFIVAFVCFPFLFVGHGPFMGLVVCILVGLTIEIFSFSRDWYQSLKLKVRLFGSFLTLILGLFFYEAWHLGLWTPRWVLYIIPCAWIVGYSCLLWWKDFGR